VGYRALAEYTASVTWQRKSTEKFIDNRYSREHEWQFDGGVVVPASPSPHIVPLPYSNAAYVDPEEAFVASLSSCHMLFFLSIAAQRKVIIDEYTDEAVGFMEKNHHDKMMMARVILRPRITFSGNEQLSRSQQQELHHLAHAECFIANSVLTEVVTEVL